MGDIKAPFSSLSRNSIFVLVTISAVLSYSISALNASIGYYTLDFTLNLSLSLISLYFNSALSTRSLDPKFSVTSLY